MRVLTLKKSTQMIFLRSKLCKSLQQIGNIDVEKQYTVRLKIQHCWSTIGALFPIRSQAGLGR